MKKFTRNFLLGEHSIGRYLRKIGLSLVVLLFATMAFAQEAQSTLEVWAKDATFCYQEDNMYEVDITMKDFISIYQLELKLNFSGSTFKYESIVPITQLTGMTASASGNVITIGWTTGTTPLTIPESDDAEGGIKVATVKFSLLNTPYNYTATSVYAFTNSLTWGDTKYKNTSDQDWILTTAKNSGALAVDQLWQDVVVDVTSAACEGLNAIATVSAPANATGMTYSWNGLNFNASASTNLVAPQIDQTVVVKNGDGCISYIKTFDVNAPTPITYTTDAEVEVNCPGGNGSIVITAHHGTPAYTYYVVPSTVSFPFANLANYGSAINVFQKPEGTYWVAVQDANNCVDLTDAENWLVVNVIDELDPFDATVETDDPTCNDNDGEISISMTGGTPYAYGYNIYFNGVKVAEDDEYSRVNLATGSYVVTFQDANGCTWTQTYTLQRPAPIAFDLDWTDTGCQEDVGSITVSNVTGGVAPYTLQYTTVLPWAPETTVTVDDNELTATDLAAGVYYVRVMDGAACVTYWENAQGDKAVKILDTEFDIDIDPIACYGEGTTVTLSVVSGSGNHVIQFSNDGETWSTTGVFEIEPFEDLTTTATFWAKDVTADCTVEFDVEITQPAELIADLVITQNAPMPPTCPNGTDGVLAVQVTGGTTFTGGKYHYKVNEGQWIPGNALHMVLVDNKLNTIWIKDANGCMTSVEYDFPNYENVIATDEEIELTCPMDKSVIEVDITSWQGWDDDDYAQPVREPVLYISSTATTAAAIYAEGVELEEEDTFGPGTYYIVARDQFGCFSNVAEVEIIEPAKLTLELDKEDAGCFGYTDGAVIIEADNVSELGGLQFTVVNNPAIFNLTAWYNLPNIVWQTMDSNPKMIPAQAGTYWVAIRDACGVTHPELIVKDMVVVESADAIEIGNIAITNVTCNVADGEGSESSDDATITVTGVTGGFGDYEYELVMGEWMEENTTGVFTNLPAGIYTLTVTDQNGCYLVVEDLEVTEPDPLKLETVKAYPSCYNEYDGFIRYMIYGGTAPFYETTNNVGQWEDIGSIPSNRWVKIETEGANANATQVHDFWAFDRRVRAGNYEIYIRDAHGCIYGPVVVNIEQPAQLGIATSSVEHVSCVQQNGAINPVLNDGSITVKPKGGWNVATDGYNFVIELWKGTTLQTTAPLQDVAADYTFEELEAGTYTVKIYETNATLAWQEPIIGVSTYFTDFHDYAEQLPWQTNSDCFYTENFVVGSPEPIDYDIDFNAVVCRNTATGSIEISNVEGGTSPYWFAISGPVGSGYTANPLTTPSAWKPTLGASEYVWEDLIHGHYNIYIKDANGCTIFKESGEVNNVDTLTVNMKLIHNAVCFEGLGEIEVLAAGGSGEYVYAVSSNTYNFNVQGEAGLTWQSSPIFEKHAGIWVGYAKDSKGCIQGGATTALGAVIQNHRVTILQPTEVEADQPTSAVADDVTCFGLATGKINVTGLKGGNGGKYSATVTGFDYAGNPVSEFYEAATNLATTMTLTGLKASTNKTRGDVTLSNADKYMIVFEDNMGCESEPYYVAVHQPEEFTIELKAKQDAFICSDDLAGIFDIVVVKGGVAFTGGTFKYKWIAKDASGATVVSTSFGFTNTFLGEAGLHYYVTAEDANGCQAFDDVMVEAPDPVVITEVKDLTCHGVPTPKARITVTGEEGRTFQVRYQKRVGGDVVGDPSGWIDFSNETYHEMSAGLTYGDANDKDGHYRFWVRDEMGCVSEHMDVTFVPVQAALFVTSSVVDGECTAAVTVSANGGIAPYEVWVNGIMVEDGIAANTPVTVTLDAHAETQVVVVRDAQECLSDEIEVDVALPADIELEAVVCTGEEEVHYVNEEYGIDELLNLEGSPYEYTYTTEAGCVHNVIVTVVEGVCSATIAEIQGEEDESPMVGHIRAITATVTAVVEGVGYFAQDASAAWSGIWILDAETAVEVGDGIHVWGMISEEGGITTLTAEEATVIEAPVEITAIELEAPADLDDEMYESVLVKLSGVRAMAAEEDGSWTVYGEEGNTAVVGTWIYEYEPVEGNFYDVTGVVLGSEDGYVLLPRMEDDIIDLTATTDVNVIDGIKFKVYPNPFNNELNIDNHDKLTRLTITNIAGQRVMDVQYPERVIRTANLVSGVYVVTLFNDNGIVQSDRIVKR
jgi:hypothetical protein